MRRLLMIGLILSLEAFLLGGCGSSNRESKTQGVVGAACFQCHGNVTTAPQLKVVYPSQNPDGTFTNFSTTVNLFVDPKQYAVSTHGGVECLQCHTGMNMFPPHNAPRTYGGWGAIWPLNDRTTNTNLSNAPGSTDADLQHTLNYYVVPAVACLGCHGSNATLMAYLRSKHATDSDRAFLPNGQPRVATFPFGTAGPQINETYTAVDCQLCHIGNNCGTCHFKAPIGQQIAGNAWTTWSSFNDNTTIPGNYDTKLGQINRWLDWTQNVASHNFNRAADLKSSNDVCSVCHSGFSDGPGSGDLTYNDPLTGAILFSISGTAYDGHSENDELALTVQRGIHTTVQHCVDCHIDTHTSNIPQTLSMGWDTGKSPTKCINCHADKAFALNSRHSDVDCTACHDADLPVMRDLTTFMVVPYHVDVNIMKAFISHNTIHGSDVDCASKCHFSGNNLALPGGQPVLFGPARGDGTKIHQ
jgi:hypothetical protein